MAIEVLMPRLGWSSDTGSVIEWIKHDGETVRVGEIICVVEGDKAAVEVEAMDSGVLRIPPSSPALGVEVSIGAVIAYLLGPGENLPATEAQPSSPAPASSSDSTSSLEGTRQPASSNGASAVAVAASAGTVATAGADKRRVSPRARRIARELGVDWTRLQGSGITGRVIERDVRQAIDATVPPATVAVTPVEARTEQAPSAASPPSIASAASTPAPHSPISGVRRTIAARMRQSVETTAPVTLTTSADATELVRLRNQIKAELAGSSLPVPSYDDLFIRIVAVALRVHPDLNASFDGDAIVRHEQVDVGLAVDTDRGLLAPVIRDAGSRSIRSIAAESARLIEAARGGTLRSDELRGGTFTITNLGMYEIDAFTPIINVPECAILGIGRIHARPVAANDDSDEVTVRKMAALSLTFDHRLVDGAPAARFLQQVKRFVEHPTLWLIQ